MKYEHLSKDIEVVEEVIFGRSHCVFEILPQHILGWDKAELQNPDKNVENEAPIGRKIYLEEWKMKNDLLRVDHAP